MSAKNKNVWDDTRSKRLPGTQAPQKHAVPPTLVPPVQKDAGRMTLDQVDANNGCRWITSDEKPWTYCGGHKHKGDYCEDHTKRRVTKATTQGARLPGGW